MQCFFVKSVNLVSTEFYDQFKSKFCRQFKLFQLPFSICRMPTKIASKMFHAHEQKTTQKQNITLPYNIPYTFGEIS